MFFSLYSELLYKFGAISFQEYVSTGSSHPVFYGDLVYKLRKVKGVANFISSDSKISISQASKTLLKFFRLYSEFLSKFVGTSFREYCVKGISHPVFYGDLVYKIRRSKTRRISSRGVRK